MAALRYIAPALAVAARAAAQSCGSASSTTTISSNADATALASCQTYSGSIAIATGTTDNIQLDGIQSIRGSLVANNVTQMVSLSASSLEEIGEMFELEQLTILSTLSFPTLKKVNAIQWTALPALQQLSFTDGVEEVGSLIIDNTQLNTLDGINLQVVDELSVTNNPYLTDITMQLGNVTKSFLLASNGRDLKVELPNLEWANNVTLRNCSEVTIPSLASINGSMGFYNGGFESLAAPNLTNVGGSLSFVSCEAVTNISMPQLTTIGGGFQLANNTELKNIDGFPAMQTVGGALDFNGEYQSVELPELKDVRGAFNLQSTQNINSVCSHFKPLSGQNNVIKGTFTCSTTSTPGGVGSSTSSGSSGSTSSGAANPMLIPGATGLLGVLAAIFGLL